MAPRFPSDVGHGAMRARLESPRVRYATPGFLAGTTRAPRRRQLPTKRCHAALLCGVIRAYQPDSSSKPLHRQPWSASSGNRSGPPEKCPDLDIDEEIEGAVTNRLTAGPSISANHVPDLVSIDFFAVPPVRLRVLFVLVVLAHHRRRILHFNVTEHPTAEWSAQQIVDAFPDDTTPAYLLRDRDSVYGHVFRQRVKGMGIGEVLTAPHSPWQNPFAERLIGSIRRECLNHVLVLGEQHLRRLLTRYFAYYHQARTHLSLDKDAPDGRPIERPELGRVIPIREVGGLHHRYVRRAA